MRKMQDVYHIREMPLNTDYQQKPLMLTALRDDGQLRRVKSKYQGIELTDGLIRFVNNELHNQG